MNIIQLVKTIAEVLQIQREENERKTNIKKLSDYLSSQKSDLETNPGLILESHVKKRVQEHLKRMLMSSEDGEEQVLKIALCMAKIGNAEAVFEIWVSKK